MARGYRRMEVFSISVMLLDSLGVVIVGDKFVVQWWYLGCNCNKTVLYSKLLSDIWCWLYVLYFILFIFFICFV